MRLDIDTYLPYLASMTLSLHQKEVIIQTVWGLMESQVLQAFDQHPVQQVERATKQATELDTG